MCAAPEGAGRVTLEAHTLSKGRSGRRLAWPVPAVGSSDTWFSRSAARMLSEGKWQDYLLVDEEAELLRITFVGQWLNTEQSRQAREHLRDSGLWRSDRPVLMDLRRVTIAGTPAFAEMQRAVDGRAHPPDPRDAAAPHRIRRVAGRLLRLRAHAGAAVGQRRGRDVCRRGRSAALAGRGPRLTHGPARPGRTLAATATPVRT